MTTTTPTTDVAVIDPVFSDAKRYALAAFLAGYRGLTRDAYALDLRQFIAWCQEHHLRLFAVRPADIECLARDLEARGRARATVARRLCTVAGVYRYTEQEGLPERSPAAHVRRPRLDDESHATGLDRNDVGALLIAAGLASAREHTLVSLLAINGLRVSQALGANIEALGLEHGHRTLTVNRNGGKIVTIPLAPHTARAIDLAFGERLEGPIFLGRDAQRLDRHAAWPIVRRLAPKAGIQQARRPTHPPRHAYITAALDAGVPLRDAQETASHADVRTTMRYDRARMSLDRHATYVVAAFLAGATRHHDHHAPTPEVTPTTEQPEKPTIRVYPPHESSPPPTLRSASTRIDHIGLGVPDLAAAKRCYDELLPILGFVPGSRRRKPESSTTAPMTLAGAVGPLSGAVDRLRTVGCRAAADAQPKPGRSRPGRSRPGR